MTLRSFVIALALLVPTVARAEPITVGGIWSPTATQSIGEGPQPLVLLPFWSGVSWDGWDRGVNYLLDEYGAIELDYLNDGHGSYTSFRFDEDIFGLTKIGGITAWTNGAIGRRSDGAFTYDSGTGYQSNSWDNPGQFALFRLVGPESTHYFLGIEDIPLSFAHNDRDYNDYVAKFETHSVPEPGTLLLLGAGFAAFAARRKLADRKARSSIATV